MHTAPVSTHSQMPITNNFGNDSKQKLNPQQKEILDAITVGILIFSMFIQLKGLKKLVLRLKVISMIRFSQTMILYGF